MRRMRSSVHVISGIALAMSIALLTPGCSGTFGGSQMVEAFKFGGGAPAGQTEPDITYDESGSAPAEAAAKFDKSTNPIDPFNEP